MENIITSKEEIDHWYRSGLLSVDYINKVVNRPAVSQEDIDQVGREIGHLEFLLSRTFWTTEDLSIFSKAMITGSVPPLQVKVIPVEAPAFKKI